MISSPRSMAYASDLLAFPFRSVALTSLYVRNRAIDDDVSMCVASPTSRYALVLTMPTRPYVRTTAFLVSFGVRVAEARERCYGRYKKKKRKKNDKKNAAGTRQTRDTNV